MSVIHVEIPYPSGNSGRLIDDYRHWLEENIGQQHTDWDWELARATMYIKISIDAMHEKQAMMLRIMWS
jgi:hypothetical protein